VIASSKQVRGSKTAECRLVFAFMEKLDIL
jgi:hypothetical protein